MTVKISDLLPQSVPISVMEGAEPLMVHHLSAQQIVEMLQSHRDAMLQLIAGAQGDKEKLLQAAPEMVAALIAMGSDTVGQEDDIRKLPAGVQAIALAEIWRLTAPEPKKFLDALLSMVQGLAVNPPQQKPQPSALVGQMISSVTSPTPLDTSGDVVTPKQASGEVVSGV